MISALLARSVPHVTSTALGAAGGIPFNEDSGVGMWLFIKVMAITALLLGMTYGLLLFLKRRNLLPAAAGKGQAGLLTVVEARKLSPRTTLYLVRHGDEIVLITESSHHISTSVSQTKGRTPGERGG